MDEVRLTEMEYRFAELVWRHQPVGSGALAALCRTELGWQKSTAYTVLKNVCAKGVLQNCDAVVTALAPPEQVQQNHARQFLDSAFGGSLPRFVEALLGSDKALPLHQTEELRQLLGSTHAPSGGQRLIQRGRKL